MDESLLLSFEGIEDRHWWFVVRRRIVEMLLEQFACPKPAVVVEVGCGTGAFLCQLRGLYPMAQASGIDASEAAVAVAIEKGRSVRVGSFESLPVHDSSVDTLLALDVLEHCQDDRGALSECSRVLRPGGIALLSVPALQSLWSNHDVVNEHVRRYRRRELVEKSEAAGLSVLRCTYFNQLLLPVLFVTRMGSDALGRQIPPGVNLPAKPVNRVLQSIFDLDRRRLASRDLGVGSSLAIVLRKMA